MTLSSLVRLLDALAAPRLPLAIVAWHFTRYRRTLARIAGEKQPGVVIFDLTAMIQYAADVLSSGIAASSAHDIYTQSWRRNARG